MQFSRRLRTCAESVRRPVHSRAGDLLRGALLLALLAGGCSIPFGRAPRVVPVPAMDRRGVSPQRMNSLTPGVSTRNDFRRVLGSPAGTVPGQLPGDSLWIYPVRAWNASGRSGVVPAARLRIRFDAAGVVRDWGFRAARTGESLPVQRPLARDTRWFRDLAPPPVPPYIDLNRLLQVGESTRPAVDRALDDWQPRVWLGGEFGANLPTRTGDPRSGPRSREYYVDRPSHLFIPPHYLIVAFHRSGILRAYWFQVTYPGGRM